MSGGGLSAARWPEGKAFAFTIVDDTDLSTLTNVRPVYELLESLGLRTTKTVWVYPAPEDPRWSGADTLENDAYRAFVVDLHRKGFEIALHGVRGTSSTRRVIREGLDRFVEIFGRNPRIHVNHSQNLDNVYWGRARVPPWRRAIGLHGPLPPATFGDDPSSPYFWADLCRERIDYVRALCFEDINTLRSDPYMPYYESRFPLVRAWFSCSNGADLTAFQRTLSLQNQARLESEGGLCILYTHLGNDGFVTKDGQVNPDVRELLTALSNRRGWFRPASEILDFLGHKGIQPLARWQEALLRLRSRRWSR